MTVPIPANLARRRKAAAAKAARETKWKSSISASSSQISTRFRTPAAAADADALDDERYVTTAEDHSSGSSRYPGAGEASAQHPHYQLQQPEQSKERNSHRWYLGQYAFIPGESTQHLAPNITQINCLQALPKALASAVTKSQKHHHITPVLKTLQWLKIQERKEYKPTVKHYNILKEMLNSGMREWLKMVSCSL